MNFPLFREAIVACLYDIQKSTQSDFFNEVIENIKKIVPPPHLSAQNGETYAKCQTLWLVAKCITKKFYTSLSKKYQLKLQMIFSDVIGGEMSERGQDFDDCWRESVTPEVLDFGNFKKLCKTMGQSLSKLSSLTTSRRRGLKCKEVYTDHSVFEDMIDVDMDEFVTKPLKRGLFVGTKKLASCVAIIITGKTRDGRHLVSVGHYAIPKTRHFRNQITSLLDANVDPETLTEMMLGSCISSFFETLELALERGAKLCLVNLAMADLTYDETSAVAIGLGKDDETPLLYYATESTDEFIEGVRQQEDSDIDRELAKYFSSESKERKYESPPASRSSSAMSISPVGKQTRPSGTPMVCDSPLDQRMSENPSPQLFPTLFFGPPSYKMRCSEILRPLPVFAATSQLSAIVPNLTLKG